MVHILGCSFLGVLKSVKRKNKVIDELNRKALEKFEIVLIVKQSGKTDSRQVIYCLNPKIEI